MSNVPPHDPGLPRDASLHRAGAGVAHALLAPSGLEPARLYALLAHSDDLALLLDRQMRAVFVGPSLQRVLGYQAAEFLHLSPRKLVHPEDIDALVASFEALVKMPLGTEMPVTYRVRHKEEGWRWLSGRGVNLLDDPAVRAVVLSQHDVTQRRAAEEAQGALFAQLLQAQKMEAIGRLAGGVAHDFNNLLSIVLGYTSIVLDDPSLPTPLATLLGEVRHAGQRAAELTRQLLAFSRKQVLEPRTVDLNERLVGLDRMLTRLIGEDVELILRRAPRLGLVRVDPARIEQAVMNLVVNARDAMPRGGRVIIETANCEVTAEDTKAFPEAHPGPHVMLSVTDTGIGMDHETQARIFEPFFTTKPLGRGTGLGLPMVYGIVRQSGGHLRVRSSPGHGATFALYLPRVDHAASLPEATGDASRDVQARGETVLLVEDDALVRNLAARILRSRGYRVLEAGDFGQALALDGAVDGEVDLLLTDVMLPRGSGPQLAEKLGKRRPAMRILFMSGYTEETKADHGLMNAANYVQKPLTPEGLLAKVREILDTR